MNGQNRHCHSVALIAVTIALLASVRTSTRAQDTPIFRERTDLVQIDVTVTDRDGRPVRDLSPAEVEVIEDGRTQDIQAFSLIDLQPDADELRVAVQPDVVTNTAAEGRVFVMLLDVPSTASPPTHLGGESYSIRVKQVALKFVEAVVGPRDQVAVVHAQGSFSDAQPFTTNRRLMLESIDRYGRGVSWTGVMITDQERVSRTLGTYRAIKELSERLGTLGGRRKAVIWIGGQIEMNPERYQKLTRQRAHPIASAAGVLRDAYRDAIQTAARNNVAIYPVDPAGLTTDTGEDELMRQGSLRAVAEDTGSAAIVNTNEYEEGFAAIRRDTGTYYLIGYSPSPEASDQGFRRVNVRVKRPDVVVRARRGYYLPPKGSVPITVANTPPSLTPRLVAALQRPIGTPGLGLDVSTATFRTSPQTDSIVLSVIVHGEKLRFGAGERLSVAYQVISVEGKIVAGMLKMVSLPQQSEGGGVQIAERIVVPRGRYQVRVAAEQLGGAPGSVVADVDASVFRDEAAMSAIVLVADEAADVRVGDANLLDFAGGAPTARRRFRGSERLRGYFELYSEGNSSPTVTGFLKDDHGNIARRVMPTMRAAPNVIGRVRRSAWTFGVELRDLLPGSYTLELETRHGRDPAQLRQVPIAVEQ